MGKDTGGVMLASITSFERNGWPSPAVMNWVFQTCENFRHRIPLSFVPLHEYSPLAAARNVAGKKAIELGCEWLLMVDNDMKPHPQTLDMILEADESMDILVPIFHRWDGDKREAQLCWSPVESLESNNDTLNVNGRTWIPLHRCGSGVIAIRPHCL